MSFSKLSLSKKLWAFSGLLLAASLVIWLAFHSILVGYLQTRTDEMTDRTLEHTLTELEGRFAQMERLSEQLEGASSVKLFMETLDTQIFYLAAGEVKASVLAGDTAFSVADHLILYNGKDAFYRFAGALSNADCQRAYQLMSTMTANRHAIMELSGRQYLAYGAEIPDSHGSTLERGAILMLLDCDKLLNWMQPAGPAMQAALALDGEIVVASDPAMVGAYAGAYAARSDTSRSHKVGNTPFEVLVFANNEYYGSIGGTFIMASALTIIVIALNLVLFLYVLRRQVFQPVVETISNIDSLELDVPYEHEIAPLPPTSGPELNALIDKVNLMMRRVRDKDRAAYSAQIHALKKQINAHFTINALNAIHTLTAQGKAEDAGRLAAGLSHLIRYAYSEDEYVSVMDEMFALEQYVEIMGYRYGRPVAFDYDLDDDLYQLQLPRMLLQPLVENAILHAFQDYDCDPAVRVEITHGDGPELRITVTDNGKGIAPERLAELRQALAEQDKPVPPGISGVALRNVATRLRTFYGRGAGVELESAPGAGTVVTLRLPERAQAVAV